MISRYKINVRKERKRRKDTKNSMSVKYSFILILTSLSRSDKNNIELYQH